jgi:hypothetical protein
MLSTCAYLNIKNPNLNATMEETDGVGDWLRKRMAPSTAFAMN